MRCSALIGNDIARDKYEIDLTFAMYRTNSDHQAFGPALRVDRPYTLQHIDWYVKEEDYSDDFKYYLATTSSLATWAVEIKKVKKVPQNQ